MAYLCTICSCFCLQTGNTFHSFSSPSVQVSVLFAVFINSDETVFFQFELYLLILKLAAEAAEKIAESAKISDYRSNITYKICYNSS